MNYRVLSVILLRGLLLQLTLADQTLGDGLIPAAKTRRVTLGQLLERERKEERIAKDVNNLTASTGEQTHRTRRSPEDNIKQRTQNIFNRLKHRISAIKHKLD